MTIKEDFSETRHSKLSKMVMDKLQLYRFYLNSIFKLWLSLCSFYGNELSWRVVVVGELFKLMRCVSQLFSFRFLI